MPVFRGQLIPVFINVGKHRLQIFRVDQKKAGIVGDLEDNAQNIGLELVQSQNSGEKKRAHLGDRCPQGHAHLAVYVPEHDRILAEAVAVLIQLKSRDPLIQTVALPASLGERAEVSLDVSQKNRDARVRERLCENLQADRFSGTGSSRDHTVPVCHGGIEKDLFFPAFTNQNLTVFVHTFSSCASAGKPQNYTDAERII